MADENNVISTPIVNDIAVNTRNTYQYNNSTIFYSLINSSFLPYYQQVVRKAQEWLDGYDPAFHKNDMVSSRIAAKIINGFKTSLFGQGLVFVEGKGNTDAEHKALNFISHEWATYSNLQKAVKQLIGYTLGLGTGALKINKTSDGKFWVESLRLDYFYYTIYGNNKVNSFTSFIRVFQTTEKAEDNYFLVEKRYLGKEKIPFTKQIGGKKVKFEETQDGAWVKYDVYRYQGTVNANTMPNSIEGSSPCDYKTLPAYVKDALAKEYGAIKIGEPQRLPFKNGELGVEIFFNESGDITNPSLPVGRALVFDCIADFMEYDMERSFGLIDLHNSKGIVGVPKALTQGSLGAVPGTGGNLERTKSSFNQLNLPGYEMVEGLNPDTQKPIINQFDIRAAEHETKQNAILKSIAVTVGVSPRAIASFLIQNGEKTDDQIQSEDDSITQWIKTHRQDYIDGINRIIETVLNQNGFSDNIKVRFSADGLLKGSRQLESIEKRMELGMLTLEDAIREYYPDLDEVQLQEKIAKAQQQKAQNEQAQQQQFDEMYGDNLDKDNINENKLD